MKTNERKRIEAVERADDRYTRAVRHNNRPFLDRYPQRSDYLRLFIRKEDAELAFDKLNTMNETDLDGYNREGIGNW